MTEFELKFEVPAASLQRVVAQVRSGKVSRRRLRACYYDTPDGALARHGIVVRVRQEGRRWVQTAKAPSTGPLERLEHNVPLAAPRTLTPPGVDLERHAGTPVGERICAALRLKAGAPMPALVALYETDVQRLKRDLDHDGSIIEIALDGGRIVAGACSVAVCELELELKAGEPAAAVRLAGEWCATHGLWLSTISKSMKGRRLGSGMPVIPAVGATAAKFGRGAGGREVAVAVLQACLQQVLANASEVAGGSNDHEHVHQLRVGIRRLRTALAELPRLTGGVDPAWAPPLVEVFRALGKYRDAGHLADTLEPQMEAAGGPHLVEGAFSADVPDLGETVRVAAFQESLLGIIGFVHGEGEGAGAGRTRKILRSRLGKLHAHVIGDGRRFLALDEAGQHSVRKRLKRLRYLAEFAAPMFPRREVEAFMEALKPAQDALGLHNDELVALHAWQALAGKDGKAWFGVGWLSARRESNARACLKALKGVARARPFWA